METSWINDLRRASEVEDGPLVATLATVRTVDTQTAPDARSVVVRRIDDDGGLAFTSDSRSEKTLELNDNPQVAVVFWMPKSRSQFRISGSVRLTATSSPDRLDMWRSLSDTARATFAWPPPGRPLNPGDVFPKAVSADNHTPASFDVWRVVPEFVDTLDLRPHPHLRRKWSRSGDAWRATVVNP